MSTPYVGEIRMFGGNFAPAGWNFCDGSLLAVGDFEALFNLIGTTYGGNGQTNFAVPDLRGRLPVHQGTPSFGSFTMGETGGFEQVTLTLSQIPVHGHPYMASTASGNASVPTSNLAANATTVTVYYEAPSRTAMGPNSIASTGGSQPHNNFQPYLCINFIISLFGIYPSQS